MNCSARYLKLRAEISPFVRLIAVSKKQEASAIKQVFEAGCRDFAENYLQEALPKIALLKDMPITWHFIGRIQSNKVKEIAAYFDVVHSVDRPEIAEKLNQACQKIGKIMPIFIQVNWDREQQKAGILPEDLAAVILKVKSYSHLALQGLMLIPAIGAEASFSGVSTLRDEISKVTEVPLPRLSMGMSHDYPIAITAGASDVRLGEAIFGLRI